jgi:hypothetical protein
MKVTPSEATSLFRALKSQTILEGGRDGISLRIEFPLYVLVVEEDLSQGGRNIYTLRGTTCEASRDILTISS